MENVGRLPRRLYVGVRLPQGGAGHDNETILTQKVSSQTVTLAADAAQGLDYQPRERALQQHHPVTGTAAGRGRPTLTLTKGPLEHSIDGLYRLPTRQHNEQQVTPPAIQNHAVAAQTQHKQLVELQPHNPYRQKKTSRRRLMSLAVSIVAIIVGCGAGVGYLSLTGRDVQVLSARQELLASQDIQSQQGGETGSGTTLAATYLSDYKVDAAQPRVLSIPSLGVQARVVPVGVDSQGQPRLPKNAHDTGWFNASALPGAKGAVVIQGACDMPGAPKGVFSSVRQVKSGDELSVEKGDGSTLRYVVQHIQVVPKDQLRMNDVMASFDASQPGLNLMTCSGTYNQKTNDRADRIIVYTTQI